MPVSTLDRNLSFPYWLQSVIFEKFYYLFFPTPRAFLIALNFVNDSALYNIVTGIFFKK